MVVFVVVAVLWISYNATFVLGQVSMGTPSRVSTNQDLNVIIDGDDTTCLTFSAGTSPPAETDLNVVIGDKGQKYNFTISGVNLGCMDSSDARLYIIPMTQSMVGQRLGRTKTCKLTDAGVTTSGNEVCAYSCERDGGIDSIRIIRRAMAMPFEEWSLCLLTDNYCLDTTWWNVLSVDRCYKFYPDASSAWTQANTACLNLGLGTHLVDLQSYEEQQAVRNIANRHYSQMDDFWTSGERPDTSTSLTEFYWRGSTSDPVATQSWTNWGPADSNSLAENYLKVDLPDWYWFDTYDNQYIAYICEMDSGP